MVERVRTAIDGLSEDDLNRAPSPGEWSIAQVIDHMIVSHGSYLAALPSAIQSVGPRDAEVKLTRIGAFLARVSGPDGDAPVPKPFRPTQSRYPASVFEEWQAQTEELARLFESAKGKDLNRKSLRNPVVKLFGMNIADVMSIAEGHFERHVRQIEARAAAIKASR